MVLPIDRLVCYKCSFSQGESFTVVSYAYLTRVRASQSNVSRTAYKIGTVNPFCIHI